MTEMNPADCLNPNAEPLSPEVVAKYFCDSYRPQHTFIRDQQDPNYRYDENGNTIISEGDRQWGVVSFYILKNPLIVDGDMDKRIIGYYKLRGPGAFPDENLAGDFARKIYTEHDSYSTMYSTPYGIMQPIVSTVLTETQKADVEEIYKEEVKSQNAQVEAFLLEQRKIEERARKLNSGIVDESLDDYVKQQLRRHAADKKIKEAKELIEQCEAVVRDSHKKIVHMTKIHPEYKKTGLEYYKRTMVELGEKEPESFYDQ